MKLTSECALELGVVERIIPELDLGKDAFYLWLRQEISQTLCGLCEIPREELPVRRYARFRAIGRTEETEESL